MTRIKSVNTRSSSSKSLWDLTFMCTLSQSSSWASVRSTRPLNSFAHTLRTQVSMFSSSVSALTSFPFLANSSTSFPSPSTSTSSAAAFLSLPTMTLYAKNCASAVPRISALPSWARSNTWSQTRSCKTSWPHSGAKESSRSKRSIW